MRDWARHLGWKVAAVLLAYLLWLAVIEEPQAIRQLEVPVRFEHIDPSLAMVRDRPNTVIVRVQAPDLIAKALEPPDVEASIDLSGRGVGKHVIPLVPGSQALMTRKVGARVIEVFPPSLEVSLEPRLAAQVAVKAVLTGTPAEGWVVTEVKVEPERVRVEGPATVVKKTSEARTRDVSVDGRRASFQQLVPVDVALPDVVIAGEAKVRVSVAIAESLGERSFADVAVVALHGSFESRVSPKQTGITLRGPEKVLAQTTPDDVVAWVDAHGLEPRSDDYRLPVQVTFARDLLRERLKVVSIEHATAGLHVYNRKTPPRAPDKSLARTGR